MPKFSNMHVSRLRTVRADDVRASRDGHEFHEAWTARKTLQLLCPTDNLIGIAIEGLHPSDQNIARAETIEIADIVLYYGKRPTFKDSDFVNFVQFKYSVNRANKEFRCSDASETLKKFAITYSDLKNKYGAKGIRKKLEFKLITNRPINSAFEEAIKKIVGGKKLTGEIRKQAEQFKKACDLNGRGLTEFASKFQVIGLAGSLSNIKSDLAKVLADWSATSDPLARARLGNLRDLVRNKSGSVGQNRNIIQRVDVLSALEIQDIDDLLPCRNVFPNVGAIVERTQLKEVISLINKLDKPLLIHAEAGVGKTVFLQTLAKAASENNEVILFDCFGGGSYRAPEDARHLPKRGLIHIANTLAFRGLCDPLLPNSENVEDLIKKFRYRLSQSVQTVRRASSGRNIILFIDAIDNAAYFAQERREHAFSKDLLESFTYLGQIPGVRLVVSSRTHRVDIAKGNANCLQFKLLPFNFSETVKYLHGHLRKVNKSEIQVAYARSGGIPRILEHLALSDRGLLDASEIKKNIELNDLLEARIDKALSEAISRGYKKSDINAFLAGLAILPPPVPLKEYAAAQEMDIGVIESFSADLIPLLELTKYGLMFRDEPTETLIKETYASNASTLRRVANNLLKQQDSSVYAARALPNLLIKLDDAKKLFNLAFDERFPASIKSIVGKRNIRYARLKAAVLHAVHNENIKQLVHLLVELSTLAAVDHRGTDYILNYPDLVVLAQDVDATRRLFETRTNWPGTRHARLAIANTLAGDFGEAYRHARLADEWISHYYRNKKETVMDNARPERLDIAAIPLCLILQDRYKDAALFMRGWKSWYGHEVCNHLFPLLEIAKSIITKSGRSLDRFLHGLTTEVGVISSALSNLEISNKQQRELIKKLARSCLSSKLVEFDNDLHQDRAHNFEDGLLRAAIIAAYLGLNKEAHVIIKTIPYKRPGIWSFRESHWIDRYIFSFLTRVVLISVINKKQLDEKDIYPNELMEFSTGIKNTGNDKEFRQGLLKNLDVKFKSEENRENKEKNGSNYISYEKKEEIQRFVNEQLDSVVILAKAFMRVLAASPKDVDKTFIDLLDVCNQVSSKSYHYGATQEYNRFFQLLGIQICVFVLSTRNGLRTSTIKIFLEKLHEQKLLRISTLIEIVRIMAKRVYSHQLAGEEAVKAIDLINLEDDVNNRADLYAQLARAIAPANTVEATEYFKKGLEQMDAIGSGDYQFTNELLLFASSLKGNELSEKDFHTLTNICELNMYEAEKFPWYPFAKGMSRISGMRGLAKLARWDDRSKISLDYTLLPYLTALIDDNKIAPEDALALLRLSDPVELYDCNTATLAKAIENRNYPNHRELLVKLIDQFERNNPGIPMCDTVEILAKMMEKTLGTKSQLASYFSTAYQHFRRIRDEMNDNINYHGKSNSQVSPKQRIKDEDKKNKAKLKKLITQKMLINEASISRIIDELNKIKYFHNAKNEFFEALRKKIPFSNRQEYIEIISNLENLDIFTKLHELSKCKEQWKGSSIAIASIYKKIANPILQLHAADFIDFGHLSGYQLKNISDMSGIPMINLALGLSDIFASPDWHVSASVWLGLASIFSESTNGEGQGALKRLLNSNAAMLTSTVIDGAWKEGLYPSKESTPIIAGLVWQKLGSPHAKDRWLAAHSVRCFASFKRWNIINDLVSKMDVQDAHPFQAPELPFFHLHARLWLLISIARIAKDQPKEISKYYKILKEVMFNKECPHVLMRHFASEAILTCVENKCLKIPASLIKEIRDINNSPFPRLNKKLKAAGQGSFFQGRPKQTPKLKDEFHLDYDFEKYAVQHLSDVFGKGIWEVNDLMTQVVRNYDKKITTMYESGGREDPRRDYRFGISSDFHSYGQQLGWHALLIVAGQLLSQYPITKDSYENEPWEDFLNRELLTRKDGWWLSDGMDRSPLEVKINLLDQGEEGLILTGDKSKLLKLAGIEQDGIRKIIVHGNWNSPDGIEVNIRSVLVSPEKVKALTKELFKEKPFLVWLPTYEVHDKEYLRSDKENCEAWIVSPSYEAGLDKEDPLGVDCVMNRPYFAENIRTEFSLECNDIFRRLWKGPSGKIIAQSETWCYESQYENNKTGSGTRLICSGEFLKRLLTKRNVNLFLLIKLQRYEKGFAGRDSKFTNTIAIVNIKRTLNFDFFKGSVNKLHESKY